MVRTVLGTLLVKKGLNLTSNFVEDQGPCFIKLKTCRTCRVGSIHMTQTPPPITRGDPSGEWDNPGLPHAV